MQSLAGTFAPLPTPFTDDGGQISEIRLARVIQWTLQRGAQGFLVNSSAGEFTCTGSDERKNLLEWALREVRSRVPIVANATSLNTGSSLDLAQHAGRHGARAAVVAVPYFGSFTQRELYQHYKLIAQYADLPIWVLDPTGMIQEETWSELLALPSLSRCQSLSGGNYPSVEGGLGLEEFSCGEVGISPMVTLFGPDPTPAIVPYLDAWAEAFRLLGSARLTKAVFQNIGIDLGTTRAPLLPLEYDAADLIRRLCSETWPSKEGAAGQSPAA